MTQDRILGTAASSPGAAVVSQAPCPRHPAPSGVDDGVDRPVETPAGESRPLTSGEIAMARSLFGDSICCSRVRVHNRGYLWFGLQNDATAMTPNGHMYFDPKCFKEDFSTCGFGDSLWFMHEMVHVWQHQLGYPVKWRGALRIGLSYRYMLRAGNRLSDYNMEAQGNLLSDYWAVKHFETPPMLWERKHGDDLALYETVLETFTTRPADKVNLPALRAMHAIRRASSALRRRRAR